MNSVGERLRLERQSQGLNLAQIAEQTRISERYLLAIEASDPEGLPGEFFFRSFVRQYANVLRLDPAEFEAELDAMFPSEPAPLSPLPAPRERGFDVAPIDGSLSDRGWDLRRLPVSLAIFVLVLLVCSGLYALWQRSQQPRSVAAKQESAPAVQTPAAVSQAPAVTPPPTEQAPATPAPAPVAQDTPSVVSKPVEAPKTAEPLTPVVPPPAVTGEGNLELEITASSDTWFSIQSSGKTVFSNVLKSGQTRTWKVQDRAKLLVGNAAGIDVKVNGKPVGPIGPSGQVRVVLVAPEGTQIVNPKKPAAE